MEMEFDVQITTSDLYDYQLHHVYTSPSGLFGTIIGFLMIATAFQRSMPIAAVLGVFVIAYFPWILRIKAKQQAQSDAFKEPLHYKLSEEGLEVSRGEEKQLLPWDTFQKAISTGKNILLYTSRVNAFIFPRKQLGDRTNDLVEIISKNMPAKAVKIRGSI